ncbi:hypothetical protein HDV00_003362 [Rhizophlyctis rosea]|nr:hypothetical protein HDV00_003362 [Rhizophlyctis rosea]
MPPFVRPVTYSTPPCKPSALSASAPFRKTPHPGSTNQLEFTVRALANEVGADVLALDYATLLSAARELDGKREGGKDDKIGGNRKGAPGSPNATSGKTSSERKRLFKLESLSTMPLPFAPFAYVPYDAQKAADIRRMEEETGIDMDEEFSDDEEYESDDDFDPQIVSSQPYYMAHRYRPDAADYYQNHMGVRPEGNGQVTRKPAALEVQLVPESRSGGREHDREGGGNNAGVALGKVFLKLPAPAPVPHTLPIWYTRGTHYEEEISEARLQAIKDSLLEFAVLSCGGIHNDKLPSNLRRDRRLIIFLKDTTDILEMGTDGAKRTVLKLLEAVHDARYQYRLPITFVAGCTPSLVNHENLGKETKFFQNLFDGAVAVQGSRGNAVEDMWESGRPFRTVLDGMTDDFEKVEMVPPAPSLLPNPRKTNDNAPTEQKEAAEQRFTEWLEQMGRDERDRVMTINWTNTEAACQARGIQTRGIDPAAVSRDTVDRNTVPDTLQPLIDSMSKNIWSAKKIDRLVTLALGCRLDVPAGAGFAAAKADESSTLDLTARHFAEGMALMRDSEAIKAVKSGTKVVVPAKPGDGDGGDGGQEVQVATSEDSTDSIQTSHPSAAHPTTPGTNQPNTEDDTTEPTEPLKIPTDESIPKLLKRLGAQLNTYEKRLVSTVVNPSAIKVGFQDLILPPSTKLLLQTLVSLPLLRPDHFAAGILSRHSINGVLLFGPPGTGKTMLAKAVAKSSGARFMNVALSDIFDKYVGEGEKNVKAVFTLARRLSPCVVFLDEVDALFGARRSDGFNSTRREVINEFMSEWDGIMSNNKGIILMGATNRPFDLDDAILRRMPRRVLVDLPTEAQRQKILTLHLQDEKLDPSINLQDLARRTNFYSGSDLKNLCVAAALARVKESVLREALIQQKKGVTEGGGDEAAAAVSGSDGVENMSTEEVLKMLSDVDDWSSVLGRGVGRKVGGRRGGRAGVVGGGAPGGGITLGPMTSAHFDIAFKEVPPSATEEMQTLIELRKWDELYGDGAHKKKGVKKGWGFDLGKGLEALASGGSVSVDSGSVSPASVP